MVFFNNVDFADLRLVQWKRIKLDRNCGDYSVLMTICQLIAEGCLITTDSGEYHLASFVDEEHFNRLYEKFILEYYAQEYGSKYKGFTSRASQIEWQLDDGYSYQLPIMQSDITLKYKNKYLIIDAKYYGKVYQEHFNVQTIHSGNIYQIFTYVKNKEFELKDVEHEVAGMLLYAKTSEDISPDNNYHMSNNLILVKTLDLNQPFYLIKEQLDAIANNYFELK